MTAPELLRRLRSSVSQPTLWRALNRLRVAGEVLVTGRARATRYHLARPTGVNVLRSRVLHRRVAEKLLRDPDLRAIGRRRLELLRSANPAGWPYHDRWAALLDGPLHDLLRMLNEASDAADVLRKESPLSTLLTSAEREQTFRAVRR